jgi:leader peptidase (prepilin peptidase) / N-methyltransferase
MLAAMPPWTPLVLTFAGGVLAGAIVNWAVYGLAWNRRPISPWSPPHPDAPPRRDADRIPVFGWLGLRREHKLHGRAFWLRPLAVELAMGAAWAALYWWEVGRHGLIVRQVEELLRGAPAIEPLTIPMSALLPTYLSHVLLMSLMTAASLIDVDEKTIPDGVTIPGTLLALILAVALPASPLPHVTLRLAPPEQGAPIGLPPQFQLEEGDLYVAPLTLASPADWPAALAGAPHWLGLAVGLSCLALWCFALAPRIWRGRRGPIRTLQIILARVGRELARPPLLWIELVGAATIVAVWYRDGAAWVSLLTTLVGMIGGGAMVWAVRIVGSAAMRREAMGFGDVTLMMMVGAFLGWQAGILIFFIAPFAGLLVGAVQLVLRRDDVIPYGPFLCLGALAVMIRWADLWNSRPAGIQDWFSIPWLVPAILGVGVVMLGAMLVIWRNIKEAIFYRGSADQ